MTALTRDPACYSGAGVPGAADVLDADKLCKVLGGHDAAYYLVHSLADADFAAKDGLGPGQFADAVSDAGLAQVIYLGAALPAPEPAATAHDTDFGTLLAARRQVKPSFILVRSSDPLTADDVAGLILANLDSVAEDLGAGAIATFARGRLRVRRLPIR